MKGSRKYKLPKDISPIISIKQSQKDNMLWRNFKYFILLYKSIMIHAPRFLTLGYASITPIPSFNRKQNISYNGKLYTPYPYGLLIGGNVLFNKVYFEVINRDLKDRSNQIESLKGKRI